eukprot:3715237-Amphidinium_carterae.1
MHQIANAMENCHDQDAFHWSVAKALCLDTWTIAMLHNATLSQDSSGNRYNAKCESRDDASRLCIVDISLSDLQLDMEKWMVIDKRRARTNRAIVTTTQRLRATARPTT